MSTETVNEDNAKHQQSHGGGDGRSCLHCKLHETLLAWIDQSTDQPEAHRVGYHIGQFLAEVLESVSSKDPGLGVEFSEGFNEAQVMHALRRKSGSVVVVEPDATVTEVSPETMH